jgi:hypothetical protein
MNARSTNFLSFLKENKILISIITLLIIDSITKILDTAIECYIFTDIEKVHKHKRKFKQTLIRSVITLSLILILYYFA